MSRGKPDPFWAITTAGSQPAMSATQFANLELTPELWRAIATKPFPPKRNLNPDEIAEHYLRWLVWDDQGKRTIPNSKQGLREAKRLQGEVRAALTAIIRGDSAGFARRLNRCGPFRCEISRAPVTRLPRNASPSALGWQIGWLPVKARKSYAVVADHLLTTLWCADRLGRCDHCGQFFLSDRRHTKVPRFCDNRCSIQFHNARRLKEGYFTRRRQKQRALVASAAEKSR